jgi:hypothetical protein
MYLPRSIKKQAKEKGKMPDKVKDMRERCVEWIGRPSPPGSPYASDDEASIEEAPNEEEICMDLEDVNGAAAGLLGLGGVDSFGV